MTQIKKMSKDTLSPQSDSENENDDSVEDESDEADDDEMGPDLSEMFKNDSTEQINEEDDSQGIATFSAGNVEKEVAKGKCIQRQLQIWDSLLELRIAMQKSLIKVNQFPVHMKPFKEAIPTQDNELKKSQVMLAKILDQLLEVKKHMLEKDAVVDVNEEPLSKKRKLNDYD